MKTDKANLFSKNRFCKQKDLHIRYLTRITGSNRHEIEQLIKSYGVSAEAIISYLDNLKGRKTA
jgi:hypothetical protein